MKNKYTGDIGDYGKLGLLRQLAGTGLSIGINWYLTPDNFSVGDGRHIGYLKDESFRGCDPQLWDRLRGIVDSGERNVLRLQDPAILQARYFSEELSFPSSMNPDQRVAYRAAWHRRSLQALVGTELVYLDPDNGLIVSSALRTKHCNKFARPEELADYYTNGATVICYQHKARQKDDYYADLLRQLALSKTFPGAVPMVLKFGTTSQRYFFFLMKPRHADILRRSVQEMLATDWGRHFSLL